MRHMKAVQAADTHTLLLPHHGRQPVRPVLQHLLDEAGDVGGVDPPDLVGVQLQLVGCAPTTYVPPHSAPTGKQQHLQGMHTDVPAYRIQRTLL